MAPVPHPAGDSTSGRSSRAIRITRAEERVLALILQGCGNAAIASALTLSRRTVEGHVSTLLQKTGCHSRTQLVLWALGRGKVTGARRLSSVVEQRFCKAKAIGSNPLAGFLPVQDHDQA